MHAKRTKRIRTTGKILFMVYILFLLYFLIFSDWYGRSGVLQEYHYNLTPLREIKRFWIYRRQLGVWSGINLLGNVVVFVPYGFFKPITDERKSFCGTMVGGFFLSLIVEGFQIVTRVGRFDVDDLILNTLGVVVGYLIFVVCNAMRRKYGAKRKRA